MSQDLSRILAEVEEFAKSFGVKITEKKVESGNKVLLRIWGSKGKVREVIEYLILKYRAVVRVLQEAEVRGRRESTVEVVFPEQ